MAKKGTALTVQWEGQEITLAALCKDKGMRLATAKDRLKRGWSIERAITEPLAHCPPPTPTTGVRTQIMNKLMDTFFKEPKRFEAWINEQMDKDFGAFYKTYVMPFLPKDVRPVLDNPQEKATLSLEFNMNGVSQPPTYMVTNG